MQKIDGFDFQTTSSGTQGVNRFPLGYWCKRSTATKPSCLLRELKVFTYLLLVPGTKGRRVRYLDDFFGDFFAFDLTADMSANDLTHWNMFKHGSVRLDVRFNTPTTVTLNCLVYAECLNMLEIDASRQFMVDYRLNLRSPVRSLWTFIQNGCDSRNSVSQKLKKSRGTERDSHFVS